MGKQLEVNETRVSFSRILFFGTANFPLRLFRAKRGSACLAIRKYRLFSFQYRRTAPRMSIS